MSMMFITHCGTIKHLLSKMKTAIVPPNPPTSYSHPSESMALVHNHPVNPILFIHVHTQAAKGFDPFQVQAQ